MLIIAAFLAIAAASGLVKLKLRTDGHALVPPNATEVRYDHAIRQQFDIGDNIVVLLHSKSAAGIFDAETIELIRQLTADFLRLPGIRSGDITSLATEPSFRMRPGSMALETLLEPPMQTRTELNQLRDDIDKIGLYTGTLISRDAHCTSILVEVPTSTDRTGFYQQIVNIVRNKRRSADVDYIGVTGAPVAEALLGAHILEDLGVPGKLLGVSAPPDEHGSGWRLPGLIPVAICVMMLVLLACFRNVLAMLVPLPGVLTTLLVVFGAMGWAGIPIYLTIAIMPVLLTVTGVINDVYLFNRYFRLLRERPGVGHIELLVETFDRLTSPLIATSLATAAGFFSFCLSPLVPVRAFGLCAGTGSLLGLLCSVTIVPALLVLINPKLFLPWKHGKGEDNLIAAMFANLGMFVVRRRRWVFGFVILVLAATPFGLRRLVVQDSWTSGFDPQSDFSRATRMVDEQFNGMHLLLVTCDARETYQGEIPSTALSQGRVMLPGGFVPRGTYVYGSSLSIIPIDTNAASLAPVHTHIQNMVWRSNGITAYTPRFELTKEICRALSGAQRLRVEIDGQPQGNPAVVSNIDHLGDFIRSCAQYGVGGVLDPADYLKTTRYLMRPADLKAKVIPTTASEAMQLWDYYRVARGSRRLRQIVEGSYSRSLTTVFLKGANFVDTAGLMAAVREYERQHLAPAGIHLGFAGDVALSQTLIAAIVTTQMQSLIWSLVGIFLVTAILGGSLRWGVYCLLPSLLAVIVKFAIMGWVGIPLGVATSMFAAMTLGLGVNCAIHLLEAERWLRQSGVSPLESSTRALASSGPPALINTLALSLGFGVLIASRVPANARLGLLLALGLVICFLASFMILPILLRWKTDNTGCS